MARNKSSKFGVADGFDFKNDYEEQEAQEVQYDNTISTKRTISQEDAERGTQGRKGYKMPRINMAFEPEVHEWVKKTSRQEGVSMTDFVNQILKKEKKSRTNR